MVDPLSAHALVPTPAVDAEPSGCASSADAGASASTESVGEHPTALLYRAALGPVNIARYLQVFERFDQEGRRPLLWHPAAGLFTLGWLVFRRLWAEALVYGLGVGALVSLCLWAWPALQAWPTGLRWGLLGSLVLVAVLWPGLVGYGLLHRRVQQRMLQAVWDARSLGDARTELARQAASGRRLWVVATAHVAVLAALVLAWQGAKGPIVEVDSLAAGPSAAVPSPALQPRADSLLAKTVPEAQPKLDPVPPALATPSDPAVQAWPGPMPPAAVAPVVSEAAPPLPEPPQADRFEKAAPASAPEGDLLATGFAINVGLFADAGNARRAQERLQQAGLPVRVQVISTRQGPRTRVRVGPYAQQVLADEAAARIRALGLDAVVFRP